MKKRAIKNLRQSLGLTQEGFARELGVPGGPWPSGRREIFSLLPWH